MVKKIVLTSVIIILILPLAAQQLPQYTQYMFTKLAHTPGYAGAENGICVTGLVRQQWVGFKETDAEGNSTSVAPETYYISVHSPVKVLRGGLGATIIQDQIGGPFKDIYLNLMYAYQTTLGTGDLGIGVQLSLLNKTIDFSNFNPPDGTAGDPILNGKGEESDMFFDAGIGFYYSVPDNYYLGFSVLQLLESKKNDGTDFNLRRQANLMGGFEFGFPNVPSIDVMPSILIKTDGASVQYDVSTLLRYQNKFWGGLTYRLQDAIALIIGFQYKDFNIGYSYDINTSAIRTSGTHEIRASYCFKIEIDKVRKIYRNTRFL
jgi:type IX secretion system PorP/SprF family membrane protein